MFEFGSCVKHREIRNHTDGKDRRDVWEHAGKTRHLSFRGSFGFRREGPLAQCSAAKSAAILNAMQLNVKQILNDITWTSPRFGAKG